MKPGLAALVLTALVTGCVAQDKGPHGPTPAASPAAASPAATAPGGAVASILCRTHRVAIQSDEQTLMVEEAAGDQTAVAELRIKIRDAITAAQTIPGCDVRDLALPSP